MKLKYFLLIAAVALILVFCLILSREHSNLEYEASRQKIDDMSVSDILEYIDDKYGFDYISDYVDEHK